MTLSFAFPCTLKLTKAHRLKSNLPVLLTPCIPDSSRCTIFTHRFDIEISHLQHAITDKHTDNVRKALMGLQYGLTSAVLECGMGSMYNTLFNEVQRSNMSKSCNTIQEAEDTCQKFRGEQVDCGYQQVGDKYLVYRDSDTKVLKSVNYSAVDFTKLLGPYMSKIPESLTMENDEVYQEPDCLNDVKAFHELFQAPVLTEPTIPDQKRCNLRVNLIQEEVKELKVAIEQSDLVEVADALCDIQYVLAGAVLEFGLGEGFCEEWLKDYDFLTIQNKKC